ncbi:RHS repeat-associated core domain-containing protein [Aureliella helgolandensis]|uniref:tRNA3(Ser)-specific nuclease WapA n=1 Tax=Aureliella helgolandensis TaxID=2527968 RepID=A0A518GBE1_9BACT|nr:RHS repeat-associated core domain-containing protein [Aureliella helgolandensis]QDV25883.1 hypothetical protein Q31a_42110 [Aureliella helgolandensis]
MPTSLVEYRCIGHPRSSSSHSNRYTYTDREWDDTPKLYYCRAGLYDANLVRFCSRDPIGYADGENLYEFERSQPSKRIDPEGTGSYWLGGSSPGDHSKICVDKPCGGYYCCEVAGPANQGSCSSGDGSGGGVDLCTEIAACLGVWVKPKKIKCQTVSSLMFAGNVTETYPQTPEQDNDMYEDLFYDHGSTWWWNGLFSSCHVYVGTR